MTVDEPVADIPARLQGLSAEEILADAVARYPGRVALASSLSPEDQALTHMIAAGGVRPLRGRFRACTPAGSRLSCVIIIRSVS